MQRSPRYKDLMHSAQYDSEDCGLGGLSLLHGHASSDFYSAPLASNGRAQPGRRDAPAAGGCSAGMSKV